MATPIKAARLLQSTSIPIPAPFVNPTDLDCAYLAGLIDGEGSIMAYVSTWTRQTVNGGRREDWIQLMIDIANTDRRMMDWIAARWTGRIMLQKQDHRDRKDCYHFVAANNAVAPLLIAAYPYLVIKRDQADIALELVRSKRNHGRRGYPPEEKARRVALANRMQDLNRKGSRPRGRRHYDQSDGAPLDSSAVRGVRAAGELDAASG